MHRTPSDETITLTTRPAFDLTADLPLVSDAETEMASGLSGPFDWEIDGDSEISDLEIDRSFETIVNHLLTRLVRPNARKTTIEDDT